VIEDLAIGVIVVGVAWWFASLRKKAATDTIIVEPGQGEPARVAD
jgi:hypothetical protein